MTREFKKPLNQMTIEVFRYFVDLRFKLENDSSCDCDGVDNESESYKMNDVLTDAKKMNCKKMNQFVKDMAIELDKRTDLNSEWRDGYQLCIDYLKWLSVELGKIPDGFSLEYDFLDALRSEISKKSYEIDNFLFSLQTVIEYNFRYTKMEYDEKYLLQYGEYLLRCVEIPEIHATISKQKDDENSMASYYLMEKKLAEFVKEFPEKAKQFESKDNQNEINIKLVTSEI
jgi:hypothetical protein